MYLEKSYYLGQVWWLMLVIAATWEAEIRRTGL
jgi:hypothetical protein